MENARVVVTIRTINDGEPHVLTVDIPRGQWTIEELHDLARQTADAAGVISETTTEVDVAVRFALEELRTTSPS
jgi:hypothetical protein